MEDRYLVVACYIGDMTSAELAPYVQTVIAGQRDGERQLYVLTKNYHVFHNFNFGHTLKDAKAIIGEIKKDTRYTNVTLCKIEKDNHA